MSDSTEPLFAPFEPFGQEYSKQHQQGLDFASFHSPSDILAPHPDLFELELDSSLAAFNEVQLQLLTVDSNDAFSFLRSDTPTCGPPSTITQSSESAYESLSSHSESFYNYSDSYAASNCSFPLDLEMDFQRIRVQSGRSDYGGVAAAQPPSTALTVDPSSFNALPTSPRNSTPAADNAYKRNSFSDYGGARIPPVPKSSSAEYYGLNYEVRARDATPSSTVSQLPSAAAPQARSVRDAEEHSPEDPRKRYKCPSCPRSFARAYNLKTHMATHDPNRLKPHVCPHRSCGRSFSRKHDLGRHLVSIHRDESITSTHSTKSVGVEKSLRGWCDNCGKGWIGKPTECACAAEVK